jgi:hypothetical protein
MAQVFPKSMNVVARVSLLALPLLAAGGGVTLAALVRSDYITGTREVVEQPIAFSHKHHVAQLGIDCKYCHTAVYDSASAGLPPTKTCMNCHQQIWQGADILAPARDSYSRGIPIAWTKVHNVPHYTYFNHSIHVNKGVGCVSCHGQIDEQNLVMQSKTLYMEWCLDCHRNPEKHLRPVGEVQNMKFKAAGYTEQVPTLDENGKPKVDSHGHPVTEAKTYHSQAELGKVLKERHMIREPQVITNCSICHR